MKRTVMVFIVAAIALATAGLWFFSARESFIPFDLLGFGIVIIVVGFAVFVGLKRYSSAKRGEPTEDEMSKKVLLRTAAMSYYVSLYLWLGILFIKDKVSLETEELLGAGILGMALSFGICWLIFHFRGVRNE